MTLDELKNILTSLGIRTKNYYTKKSFIFDAEVVVGCYAKELKEDFYFHNNYDDKIYMISKENIDASSFEKDDVTDKFMIPLIECTVIYPKEVVPTPAAAEEEDFEELDDAPYSQMTIRDYFAIKHLQQISNKRWLNNLINENK